MDNVDLKIPEISDLKLLDIDTDAEWNKLAGELGFHRKAKILRFDVMLKIAAAVLIILATTVFIMHNNESETQTFAAIDTPIETIVEHSTAISVNRNSSVTCRNSKDKFCVNLKGEAYFDVEKNPERTFEICTQDVKVIVHGTSFNVCQKANATTVTVTSGIVEVVSPKDGKSVKITKDEELTYTAKEGFVVKKINNYNTIAWKLKEFKFNNTELGDIMQQLSQAYGFEYKFEDIESANHRISGTFSNQSLTSIINIINQTLDETNIIQTPEGGYAVVKR